MTDLAEQPVAVPVQLRASHLQTERLHGAPKAWQPPTALEHWLEDQKSLTAVERFAQHHATVYERNHGGRYRDLLPLATPGPGEQYAFEVDLDSCTGCKSCVAACHSMNGLDENESFRSVGTLFGGTSVDPIIQTVTSACNHCVDPACLNGCPTLAYEKDPVTGIVKHLDDQCIGCRYCTLTCPYEVPSYNTRLGIVRKCDMCSDRLAAGQAPACVQACPTESIAVRTTAVAAIVEELTAHDGSLVPAAPSSRITMPTTTYRSDRRLPAGLEPGDHHSVEPAHAHTPLAVTLVLTQVAVGIFSMGLLQTERRAVGSIAFLTGVLALGASLFHLGRPSMAWKAVLGLRSSWVSREIVAFSAFAGLSALYALSEWAGLQRSSTSVIGGIGALTGIGGIASSVMIYAKTRKRWWAAPRTTITFTFTTVVGALAWAITAQAITSSVSTAVAWALIAVISSKLAWDLLPLIRHRGHVDGIEAKVPAPSEFCRSVALLRGPLRQLGIQRLVLGGAAIIFSLTAATISPHAPAPIALAAVAAALWSELVERRLFFLAVCSPRMPAELR